jgi:hypothetical protein
MIHCAAYMEKIRLWGGEKNMNKKQVLIGLLFLLLLGPIGTSHAALVFTENFNDATGVLPIYTAEPYSERWSSTNYYVGGLPSDPSGWIFSGQAYLAENGNDLADRAILLNETTGSMSNSIGGLIIGDTYLLTFDHWGDNRPGAPGYEFSVSITGSPTNTISRIYPPTGPGVTESIYFKATGTSVTLSFQENSLGQASPIIDNISISAVPIPAGVWLLGSALVGLVGLRKRLKR